MTNFAWLQEWYAKHCDGDWEHEYGVRIDTLDNPGWTIDVDLVDTELETREFIALKIERSTNDWIRCRVEDKSFKGWGGPSNLDELIQVFRRWASEVP